ncbi:MAG: Spy/CpxP family protein refolding chaperone [Candidatus Zhuqueibacterota bacterium]
MDIFTKNRLTIITIILLVIFNLITLAIIWSEKIRPSGRPLAQHPIEQRIRTVMFLKNELGLKPDQVREYRTLRSQYRERMRTNSEEIRMLKKELLNQLFQDKIDSLEVERIIGRIGDKQEHIERLTLGHFHQLKKLCGNDQQQKLHRLLGELFRPPDRPPEIDEDMPRPQHPDVRPPREEY